MIKGLFVVLLLIGSFMSSAQDAVPYFPGGKEKWTKYITGKSVVISDGAPSSVKSGVKYSVKVTFYVEPTGKLTPLSVICSPANEYLEQQCMKAITDAPEWVPGRKNGKYHKRELTQPFGFYLQED